jgi:hypothetical protein
VWVIHGAGGTNEDGNEGHSKGNDRNSFIRELNRFEIGAGGILYVNK